MAGFLIGASHIACMNTPTVEQQQQLNEKMATVFALIQEVGGSVEEFKEWANKKFGDDTITELEEELISNVLNFGDNLKDWGREYC